jgi:hypothetical protein
MEAEPIEEVPRIQPQHHDNHFDAAIVSGSDANGPNDDSDSSASYMDKSSHHEALTKIQELDDDSDSDMEDDESPKIPPRDKLYNPNKDDEDEAWVYKHLRGGMEEPISIRSTTTTTKDDDDDEGRTDQATGAISSSNSTTAGIPQNAQVLKPRNSDAVLSCPCCFQIVCMDCQRHERYSNQFRAMFVMNIEVSWHLTLSPEIMGQEKKAKDHDDDDDDSTNMNHKKQRRTNEHSNATSIPPDPTEEGVDGGLFKLDFEGNPTDKNEIYYSVHCNGCKTQVAALNMRDEVYHFFGCLVSS